jgi:hypothetical protein
MAIDTTQRGLQQSTEHRKRKAHEREKREREQDRELSKNKGLNNISFASTNKKNKKKAP